MSDENQQIRGRIRAAITAGRLPRAGGHQIYGGKGDGLPCACCGKSISKEQVQYDVEWSDVAGAENTPPLSMHLRCHDAWSEESAALTEDAVDVTTAEVAARVTVPSRTAKRLFQIAYDEQQLVTRGRILRAKGYEVISVFGNEAAKTVLGERPQVDLFVIGHNAPEPVRLEMAHWLRRSYPSVRILALNPPGVAQLDALKFNASYNAPPNTWLPLVEAAITT